MFYASLADGSDLSVKAGGLTTAKTGTEIKFGIPAAACHLFDAAGNTILNGDLSK
jgi:multiple sugar transport system ATP-binding protein